MSLDMMKVSAINKVQVIGKVMEMTFREGTGKSGAPYASCTMILQVPQTFGGKDEIDEIRVSRFVNRFKKDGNPNSMYDELLGLKSSVHPASECGIELASIVSVSGELNENNFMSRTGGVVNTWQIRASFINVANVNSRALKMAAAFEISPIKIIDLHDELDREGEETGRICVSGAVVGYNGRVDVLNFLVEHPQAVDMVHQNWEIGDTVNIKGRIRSTSIEVASSSSDNGSSAWGNDDDDIMTSTTRHVNELIIVRGSDEALDEDYCYEDADIKKGLSARKMRIEQLQMGNTSTAAPAGQKYKKYEWE